jgi:hypothetical protein
MPMQAIKLTQQTLRYVMTEVINNDLHGDFAHACLTSTYDGENWYFVRDTANLNQLLYDFPSMIVTEDVLRAKYTFTEPEHPNWIELKKKYAVA